MTTEPRAALDRLIAALEAHFDAIVVRRSIDDPRIDDAYDVLAAAFEVYDESLLRDYGEVMPFVLDDDEHDDDGDPQYIEDFEDYDDDEGDEVIVDAL